MGQRLGLAAALLGDPHTLLLDEPANGLDPQGIQWMRQFLKHLAGEGRAVFVSSHLLSEMALMADHLVVIGRGRMIANGSVAQFLQQAGGDTVLVRTPQASELADVLRRDGITVNPADGGLRVSGLGADAIGDLAFEHRIRLHELSPQAATLEDAFLGATAGAEEYAAHDVPPGVAPTVGGAR
jgi:ABC-2 type transport system ATP-binding protein